MTGRARVKVKKKVTTRAEAAAEFGRKKTKLKRKQGHRRIVMIVAAALCCYALIGGWWLVHAGKVEKAMEATNTRFWSLTASMGFQLGQIALSGREHADMRQIKEAIAIHQGEPILALSLPEMKARLERIPEVKSVVIGRDLPATLRVCITERVPAALWQNNGNVQWIDREGVVLARDKYHEKIMLPTVVGPDAPQHIGELLALLDAVPSLKPDVVAAIRVGSRRWNIQLSRDITVMLPEEEPAKAWKRFAVLINEKSLLTKAIRTVDMRLEDRVFILPVEENKSLITLTNATREL